MPVMARGIPLRTASAPPAPVMPTPFYSGSSDPNELARQRWAVIYPAGIKGRQLLQRIKPLIDLRGQQQRAAVLEYAVPPGMSAVEAERWKQEVLEHPRLKLQDRPRYLLILGDLDQVSAEFQRALSSTRLYAGRLAFDQEEDYSAYAAKVVAQEARGLREEPAPGLFFTACDGSLATNLGYKYLMTPSLRTTQEDVQPVWRVRQIGTPWRWSGEELLARAAEAEGGFLFTMSHGIGAPVGGWASPAEQRALQGAMSLGRGNILKPDDLRSRAFLPGGIWFYFACFGAGTPTQSDYYDWLAALKKAGQFSEPLETVTQSLALEAGRPFVSSTVKAALANPQGPLAIVGHIDLAWSYSFYDYGESTAERSTRFTGVINGLLTGSRLGPALHTLTDYASDANQLLVELYNSLKRQGDGPSEAFERQSAHTWMLRQDVGAYLMMGDPAARLPCP